MAAPSAAWQSWCQIDLTAIRANVAAVRARLRPGVVLASVVKANAYGHGLELCAPACVAAGADWLVVNSPAEALRVRQAGVSVPVYLCVQVPPAQAALAVRARARVVVASIESAEALAQAGRAAAWPVPVHLKLETGMHRQGLAADELIAVAARLSCLQGICLEGLTTHLADSDAAPDAAHVRHQCRLLEATRQALAARGLFLPVVHAANSAAALLWPGSHASLVRVGLATYGLWPSPSARAAAREGAVGGVGLRPALSWRARVLQVTHVAAGECVGYGCTWTAPSPRRLAVLPLGYADGVDRRLGNLGHVLLHGRRAPVRGRICMNLFTVDVTDTAQVAPGDTATLIGRDGDEEITADQWAAWMGTINYEVVARIHPDQPRWAWPT